MTQGKGKFWQGTRGQWLPACPLRQGASVAPSQPALTTCLQHSSCKCGACTRSSSAKKIFLKLLELLLAAGVFLPSGQLCKTLKEQRLNLVRANQLCRSPKIAYLRDLKKIPKQTKKTLSKTPNNPPPRPSHLTPKQAEKTLLHSLSTEHKDGNLIHPTKLADPQAAAGTLCQPLRGSSLGTQLVLEAVGPLPLPSSMPRHHHVVCSDGNGCRRESSS